MTEVEITVLNGTAFSADESNAVLSIAVTNTNAIPCQAIQMHIILSAWVTVRVPRRILLRWPRPVRLLQIMKRHLSWKIPHLVPSRLLPV